MPDARLGKATDLVVRIAHECIAVARLGLIMVDVGYDAAKGDPACGVGNAIAGAQSAIWIALINLRKRTGKGARKVFATLEVAYAEMLQVHSELMKRAAGLRRAVQDGVSPQLSLDFKR